MSSYAFTIGTFCAQTAFAGSLASTCANYLGSTIKITRLAHLTPNTAAFILGAGTAAGQFLLDQILSKKFSSSLANYALNVALSCAALMALKYSGKVVQLTGKESAYILLISSFAHLLLKIVKDQSEESARLKGIMKDKESEISNIQGQLIMAQDKLETESNDLTFKISELQQAVSTKESKIQQLGLQIKELNATTTQNKESEIGKLKQELEEKSNEIIRLKQTLTETRANFLEEREQLIQTKKTRIEAQQSEVIPQSQAFPPPIREEA